MIKMKKLFIFIIAGILLAGTITAFSLSLSNTDFKTKVTTISSDLMYSKLLSFDKIDEKEIPKDTIINLDNSILDITKNEKGVIRVRSK